jgi:hypothetical protein
MDPFDTSEKLYGVSGKELKKICMRESRCSSYLGIHSQDEWAAKKMYNKSVAKGWVNLSCPNYLITGDSYRRWGVRGPFGLSAAYHIRYLDTLTCPEPELLDNFYYSLYVAIKMMQETPDCVMRVRRWVGEGNWQKRSFQKKREAVKRQCGKRIADNLEES